MPHGFDKWVEQERVPVLQWSWVSYRGCHHTQLTLRGECNL